MAVTDIFELAGINPSSQEATTEAAPPQTSSKPVDLFEFASSYKPPEEYVKWTNEDVLKDPARTKIVRDYMVKRKGDHYKQVDDQEVFDDFMTHMRWANTNDISTIGEARTVFSLDEKDKKAYAEAYQLYDKMEPSFRAGGWSEFGKSSLDHTLAVVSSPSSWIGGFIGRGLSKPVTKLVTGKVKDSVVKEVVKEVAKAPLKETVKGATKEVAKTTLKETVKKAAVAIETQVAKTAGSVVAKKSRQELVTAAVIATATDSLMSGNQEHLWQQTKMEAGAQKEIDWSAVGVASVFGLVGGAASYLPDAFRGAVKLTDSSAKIKNARVARAKAANDKVGKEVEEAVKSLATDWDAMAKEGQVVDAKKLLRDRSVDWFFDVDNEKSFIRILQKHGAQLPETDKGFSHQMLEYARGLSPQTRAAVTKILKPFGVNFGEMIEIFAGTLKEGGENLSKASQAKRLMEEFHNVSLAKRKASQAVLDGEDALEKNLDKGPSTADGVKYVTSVWKRLLVSHIATTAVNVKGWGLATSARALSEILHGGVLGSVGMTKKLLGSSTADKTLAQSSALFKSNLLLLRSLVDPLTTIEGFTTLLDNAPSKHKKTLRSSFFGGVGDEGPEMFNLNPKNRLVSTTEGLVDKAAGFALVRAQDIYTKSVSGLKALDKVSRLETGRGIEDLLAKGETHLVSEEGWDKVVRSLLEDTYSVDYTRGKGLFNEVAHTVEKISRTPGAGFIFPFGRFINNTVAFAYQYSPLAFLPLTKYQKGLDLQERLMKASVGTAALAMVYQREKQKQAEGLQWSEERTSTGDVQDVQNLFPLSLYNLFGRIMVDVSNGSGIPEGLFTELVKQVGPFGILKDLTSSNPITDFIQGLTQASEGGDTAEFAEVAKMIGELAMGFTSGIAAGFTRPLDQANDFIGASLDIEGVVNDSTVDKKLARGSDAVILEFSRYTNTLFNVILGEDSGKGRVFGALKKSSLEEGPVKDPNPISRLFGKPLKARQDSIDILLGMADLAPYRFESLTSGVPEYDNFINGTVFPVLERKAEILLKSDFFASRPLHIKRAMVRDMLKTSRQEILEGLDNGSLGEFEDRLYNERKKFLALDQAYRAEAKKALNITVDDRDLTIEQIAKLKFWIEITRELDKDFVKRQ